MASVGSNHASQQTRDYDKTSSFRSESQAQSRGDSDSADVSRLGNGARMFSRRLQDVRRQFRRWHWALPLEGRLRQESGTWQHDGSLTAMELDNDSKIRFGNAFCAILEHSRTCQDCRTYLDSGDGDLCAKGKDIIAFELAYADMTPRKYDNA